MAKMTRTKVVQLMEAVGFSTASALSTGRLQKKINRLDKVASDDLDLENEELQELLSHVLDLIDSGESITVEEDRPEIPRVEEAKQAGRASRGSRSGGGNKRFDAKTSKYKWDEILNGNINVLEQGTDYDCKTAGFVMQIRNVAKKKGVRVKIKTGQGQVIVQAVQ